MVSIDSNSRSHGLWLIRCSRGVYFILTTRASEQHDFGEMCLRRGEKGNTAFCDGVTRLWIALMHRKSLWSCDHIYICLVFWYYLTNF